MIIFDEKNKILFISKMVLLQFTISNDDLLGNTARLGNNISVVAYGNATLSSVPCSILAPTSLNSGKYRAKLAGLEIVSGAVNGVSLAFQPQILLLQSSAFQFRNNGTQGLTFSNNGQYAQPCVVGNREFEINIGSGLIDLSLQIYQFGNFTGGQNLAVSPWNLAPVQTWVNAQFAYFILTLDIENYDSQFPVYERK